MYHKRHGWIDSRNFVEIFNEEQLKLLNNLDTSFIFSEISKSSSFDDKELIINKIKSVFDDFPFYKSHIKGLVIKINPSKLFYLNEYLEVDSISWSSEYEWARKRLEIDKRGAKPKSFNDFIELGDFIYLKQIDEELILDQIPVAEASLVSIDPNNGKLVSYVGGIDFNKSNFDRVRLSYPQSGSSFKPFIYASALANGYNLSSLINDAPIAFEDKNLESVWKPQNYTGKFYGPTTIREALVQSINIVSIKLLRELGINKSHEYIEKFGFEKNRLPADLSLALGSGNFSPVEMVRAFSVIANGGYLVDPFFIDKIVDRDNQVIYSHQDYIESTNINSITAFPWLDTIEMETKRPYTLLKPLNNKEKVIDERIAYLVKDILKEHMKRGSAGRRSALLKRDDIYGKTGTTNDSISTWFSGFHEDLVTTVWVGTDDFSSLGKNEYGSSIALPIWVDYMSDQLEDLEIKGNSIPEKISFIKVNPDTGKPNDGDDINGYFELFLDENILN